MSDLQNSSCGCNHHHAHRVNEIYRHLSMADAPLAMAYVPYQSWNTTRDLGRALNAGTIFPELQKPFCGKGGKCW